MPSLRKKIAISAASAALALAYPAEAAVQANTNACYPDSGYALSMQKMHTEKVMGVYYIKEMKALSLGKKDKVDRDQGHTIDADSMQLNAYLRGTERDNKKVVYWLQDTVTYVYSKKGPEQYLSSEAYKFNANDSEDLVMSTAKGKGSVFSSGSCTASSSDTASKGITYQYTTNNMPIKMPQYGYLQMNEHLKDGRIVVSVEYWNGSYSKPYTYDAITFGRKGEFAKADFVSNKILDTEFGFGGDGCGSTAYFMKMNAYLGMYSFNNDSYAPLKDMKGNVSTAEVSADLSCRYDDGLEEFYNSDKRKQMLKIVARIYDEKVK